MKKVLSCMLLTGMLAVQICGCGAGKKEASDDPNAAQGTEAPGSNAEGTQGAAGMDSQGLSVSAGGILDPSAVSALAGKDNSLDIYSAAARVPLQTEKPENAMEGGRGSCLAASGVWHFQKHLFGSPAESWDELVFVTAEGKADSERIPLEDQLWAIGPAAGTDHYVTLGEEARENGEGTRCVLMERDENAEKLREFPLDFMEGDISEVEESLLGFAVDKSGAAHLIRNSEEGIQYLLVSQEGDILAECTPAGGSYMRKLVALYDGRVALLSVADGNGGGVTLEHMDAETGSLVKLAAWEGSEEAPWYVALLDEETLLYADKEGIYRSGLSGKNSEILYRWSNHGILAHEVSAMQADGEGRIALIYRDSQNDNYLCLEPTTEEVTVCEITMGVRPGVTESYRWAVSEFNKRYPICHIELVEYGYQDTTLLTQLTAGKGPVLIDTSMVNFEDLEELWEPLDIVMEQLGVMEGLQPAALELGRIGGTLYGMARDFGLSTVIALDPDLKDWDYDTFFRRVQDRPELEAVCNYYNFDGGGFNHLIGLLNHGLEDSYYLVSDEETGTMSFDSDRFRRFLEMAEKYFTGEEDVLVGSSLMEGRALCNTVYIGRPGHIAACRIAFGEDAYYVGYPTGDGAAHFKEASSMLSIRRSATKEEKEAAAAFIALCLSYEGQSQAAKESNFRLSVRGDVLEEQIAAMGKEQGHIFDSDLDDVRLSSDLDIERDRETLLDMIDQARPVREIPDELQDIIYEELTAYFAGGITEDMLIDHLESRVGLYLGERY